MKIGLFSLLFLLPVLLYSQDTIKLRDGNIIVGTVIEIGEDIKFKKAENPDGPLYSIPRNKIKSLRLINGQTESFETIKEVQVIAPEASYNELIQIRDDMLFYKGKRLSERNLEILIRKYQDEGIRIRLQKEFRLLKKYKHRQINSVAIGGGASLGIPLLSTFYGFLLFGADPFSTFQVSGLVGLGIGTAAIIIYKTNKTLREKKLLEIAEIYNQER